ncbi:protein kinase domain-containing protein [Pseudonocardia sp. GCM10023141]|uniref:protein kinase domain-containing protein n=1 Tax=Pseudonocardia sp. GCM10023141 TaxID=3252653 RepID=UPI00360E7297
MEPHQAGDDARPADAQDDPAAAEPPMLGRYRVLGRLGVGGMGRVLLGVDEVGRRVALKIVHAELASDQGFRERFRREIQIAAAAPAWFTAPVLDADPDAERPWLATAYIEGPSLAGYVSQNGPLDEYGVAALAVRLADGLAALHSTGLVHRDIKPSNVLLAEDGPRLIDFGISRALDGTALTQTGKVIGTPEYMSPEQASGERVVTPAGDMFSFGSLLVYAGTGTSPFASDSAQGSVYRIVYGEPDLGRLTGRVREVAAGCLQKDPAARPTAVQARASLRAATDPTAGPADLAAAPTVVVRAPDATRNAPTLVGAPSAPGAMSPGAMSPGSIPPGSIPLGSMYAPVPARAPQRPARTRVPGAVWLGGAAVVGAVLALAVVFLLTRGGGGATTPTTTAAAPPPATSRVATPTPTADPAAGATIIDGATDTRFGSGTARFATPSRNIACMMGSGEVRCDVVQRAWQLPPKPAACQLAWGTGATLRGTGQAELTCAGDTVADATLVVLGYGEGVQLDSVVCVSRESGLSCQNPTTHHGFLLSRETFEVY